MKKSDWHRALDDVMSAFGVTTEGVALYRVINDHHSKPYNKKIKFAMACGACASKMYFGIDRIHHTHLAKAATPPAVTCPSCNHTGNHDYEGLRQSS